MARILILEDEKLVARDLQKTLAGAAYETMVAASGEEALQAARRDPPDVALVDIHLAGKLDGIETAQALRDQVDPAIVFLTAHSDEQTLERAAAAEPCGYLVKPFDATTLLTTLRMAVHKGMAERSRRSERRWQSAVLDQLTVGLVLADAAGKVVMINSCGQALTGWTAREANGQELVRVLTLRGENQECLTGKLLDRALRGKDNSARARRASLVSRAGATAWVEVRVSRLLNAGEAESEEIVGVTLVFWPAGVSDFQPSRTAGETAEPAADPVTGLPGRSQAVVEIRAARSLPPGLFIALFILDRYDLIAHKYGPRVADELLTYFGTFLAQEVPHCRGLFRWTGPSFVALFGPEECLQSAVRSISRCSRAGPQQTFEPSGTTLTLVVSSSAEVYPIDDRPVEMLISQIDSCVAMQTRGRPY